MTATENNTSNRWHLGREIPLALILTVATLFVGQTIAGAYWVAITTSRLDQLERKMEASTPQAERIIRLEEKVGWIQQGIAEIKLLISRPQPTR